jgi:hypothetical protein
MSPGLKFYQKIPIHSFRVPIGYKSPTPSGTPQCYDRYANGAETTTATLKSGQTKCSS